MSRTAEETLAQIERLTTNGRATWFGLLGLLAFVGTALLAHRDADFFLRDAATTLPLIGIDIPVYAFFIAAPVAVAAVHAYLHLYLMHLWDALAEAPARIGDSGGDRGADTPLSERVYPWLLTYAALRLRNRLNPEEARCALPRALGGLVEWLSFFLGWAAGPLVLAALWYRSMPTHDVRLTLWIGVWMLAAWFIGATGYRTMRRKMAGQAHEQAMRRSRRRRRSTTPSNGPAICSPTEPMASP